MKLAALFTTTVLGASWNYKKNGLDWPSYKDMKNNECNGRNQSPIDLTSSVANVEYSWNNNFGKIYSDIYDTEIIWDGHASKVNYNQDEFPHHFTSSHNTETRKTTRLWKAA
jgi:carbonic anhydrase